MTYKTTAPDGRVIFVEAPEGATDKEIIALARAQHPAAKYLGVPIAKPGEKVEQMPSPSSAIGQRFKERAGDIAATAAATVVPAARWFPKSGMTSGMARLATRLLASEAGEEGGQAATGQKVTPGLGAATQLLGEGVGAAIKPLVTPATYGAFANRTAKAAAQWLKDKVSAWAALPGNAKGMYEMAHVTGPRLLSENFNAALNAVKKEAGDAPILLLEADARELGLAVEPISLIQKPTASAGPAPVVNLVKVPASQAIDAVTGRGKKDPALYRRAVDAITQGLDQLEAPATLIGQQKRVNGPPVPLYNLTRDIPGHPAGSTVTAETLAQAGYRDLGDEYRLARREYQIGAGFIEHATKGKYLYGERLDPVKAHEALDKFGQTLMRRGMDEFRAILRGPGAKPVEAVPHHPFLRRIEGTLAGGAAGAAFGLPHAIGGAAGGLVAAGALPARTFRNVPLTPAMRFAGQLAPALVGEGAREAARDFGITKNLPSYGP